ncbi:MAG: DUF1636 family protein, partial [Rhizobiaceae bacterium]|nr:DUF1636 family protein [Rhizobiaceae bacterium]
MEPELTSERQADPESVPEKAVAIVVCRSCRGPDGSDDHPRPGSRLAEDARRAAAPTAVRVRQVGCLGNCSRGLSAAILREGSW